MKRWSWKVAMATLAAMAFFQSTAWAADRVSGHITRTYVIVEDTDLVGDVTCDVGSTPCFSFGASDVELRLNGFSITGTANAVTGCDGATFPAEAGISTGGQSRIQVRGPGLVQRFRGRGVIVIGSRNARIVDLTVSTTCSSGIFITGDSFDTLVEGNLAVRNGASAPGNPCGGIWVTGHNSRVRLNDAHGNGYAEPADDFGIGVLGTGSGNLIEENTVTGNTNGIFVGAGTRDTTIRQNTVVGNPGIQVSTSHRAVQGVDILNMAPAGQTTFERNTCVTSVNAPCTPGRR